MTGNEAILKVIDALESVGVPYMVVGSYSSNLYGIPRSTEDYFALSVMNALTRLATELELIPNKPEEVFGFLRRIGELRTALSFVLEARDKNTVFWIERRGMSGRGRSGHARRS